MSGRLGTSRTPKSEKDFVTFWPRQGHVAHELRGWVRKHGVNFWAIGMLKSSKKNHLKIKLIGLPFGVEYCTRLDVNHTWTLR